MNNGTDRKPTPQQLRELMGITQGKVAEVIATYYASASFDEIQALLKGGGRDLRDAFAHQIAPLFGTQDDSHRAQYALWEKYCRQYFGMEVDLSQVRIPAKPTSGKWRLIMVPHGLTMNRAAATYKKILVAHDRLWGIQNYTEDLDAEVTENARTSSDESYAIWVRDEPIPDKEYLGKSTHDAELDSLIGETLLERLEHGIVHFIETKKHLDEGGITLCIGSRREDGLVPYVGWCSGKRRVLVDSCIKWYAGPMDGLRQVVS